MTQTALSSPVLECVRLPVFFFVINAQMNRILLVPRFTINLLMHNRFAIFEKMFSKEK